MMSATERVNVLLVDDQPVNLLALETILKNEGLNIVKAMSGNEALGHLLETEFSCIILDVKMPDMDGFELARIIRADDRTKYIPLIFASGHQQTQLDVFKGYETGAVDYLLKPIDATVVRSKVNVFAELSRKELARRKAEAELAKYAEELKRSNSELDQYASVAAHDLQAPLRRIMSCVGIFNEEYGDKLGPDAKKWLEMMNENSKRMQTLISDLLAYSKVGKSQTAMPLDVGKTITEVLEDLAHFIEESGAKISYRDLPVVHVGALDLRQLLQNLIGNAIKYRKKDSEPEVRISAEKRDAMWLFQVADNGIGIDPTQQSKLFAIFSRLHNGPEYPGTGIGLAICKKVVERYGGKIWIESEVGKGSTFQFTLPGLS